MPKPLLIAVAILLVLAVAATALYLTGVLDDLL
jgi:hypothetical protein